MPKVDFLVIIPTHNRVVPLRTAIGSAYAQTDVTKAIIVADDHPEGTANAVVREFPEVIYIKNPVPTGGWPGRVRNFAFEQSRRIGIEADYVHFLDNDDTVPPNHYATIKQTFVEHPNIGVVFGVATFLRILGQPGTTATTATTVGKRTPVAVEHNPVSMVVSAVGAEIPFAGEVSPR